MKKVLKGFYMFILFIFVCSFIFFSFFVVKGYNMYKDALRDKPIKEVVNEIKNMDSFSKIENLSKIYVDAVISVEDHRFYKHNGVDYIALVRALIHDIRNRDFSEGGSTITQQLSKNVYFSQEKKLERKFAEMFMAWKIEEELSKDEILELYLSTSYFGDGYYNVRDASVGYFGKEPINLTNEEAVMLAGIPNAPSVYAPTNDFKLAKERQRQVLDKMVEYGYLSKEEMKFIFEQPINVLN